MQHPSLPPSIVPREELPINCSLMCNEVLRNSINGVSVLIELFYLFHYYTTLLPPSLLHLLQVLIASYSVWRAGPEPGYLLPPTRPLFYYNCCCDDMEEEEDGGRATKRDEYIKFVPEGSLGNCQLAGRRGERRPWEAISLLLLLLPWNMKFAN